MKTNSFRASLADRPVAGERSVFPRLSLPGADLRSVLPYLNLLAILVILALDWITPAGIVVGIFLCLPILLASALDHPRHVAVASVVSMVGFLVAAWFGRGPISPAQVWVPNRIFAFLTLPASTTIALLLQRRRLEAERTRDLNRLLMSLLAHDLRSPLTLASQGFDYVIGAASAGRVPEIGILQDTRARLGRSLRAIEIVLTLARAEVTREGAPRVKPYVRLREEIESEVGSFAEEAAWRGKTLHTSLDALGKRAYAVDALVLRQALAILLDNALRYAVPGPVLVEAGIVGPELRVRVADSGTGSVHGGGEGPSGGSGLGLELSRTLVTRAGGRLELERTGPEGTAFVLRLPISAGPDPGPTPGGTRRR